MKRNIITLLIAGLLLLTACGKASDAPTSTDSTQPTGESTLTQPTDAPTAPVMTEPTPAPTESEATEPTPMSTEPEPSKDDLSYYPYPLLDMTYGEIKALYGELTAEFGIAGGSCPYVPQLKILLEYSVPFSKEIPDDQKPMRLQLWESLESNIFPGLNVGMRANEMSEDIEWIDDWSISGHDDGFSRYIIFAEVDSYLVSVSFKIPEEVFERYGYPDEQSDEQYELFKRWGDEYRKNIFNQDDEIQQISICLKRS